MGSPGSRSAWSGGNAARRQFSTVQWGSLAFVAGAHAAGLLALSGLGGPAPAQLPLSAPATLSVRLIAPPAPAAPPSVTPVPVKAPPVATVAPHSTVAKPATRPARPTPAPQPTSPRPSPAPVLPAETSPHPDDPPRVADAAPSSSPSGSAAAPDTSSATPAPPALQGPSVAVTPASFDAAYLHNPAPTYPRSSRRRGDEGKVILKVHVLGDGSADAVEVAESSGHSRLDEAAREAVRNWRFVPAQQGEAPVDSWLRVPIVFRLDD